MATVQPVNYLGAMPQIDLGEQFARGLQIGNGLREIRVQQQAQEQAAQRQALYQQRVQEAMTRPSAQAFTRLALEFPEHREAFKDSWAAMSAEQQKAELGSASQAYAALQSGRPDIAQRLLEEHITAAKNSGQPAGKLESLLEMVSTDPQRALGAVGVVLAGLPGGDKVLAGIKTAGEERRADELQPAAVREGAAKAKTAEVTAQFAEQNALLDLEKKGWDIKTLQNDIQYKREANRIAAMNAAANREGNDLKREELRLKVEEARRKLAADVRDKVATAEAGATSIDNMLNTIERIKQNPRLDAVVGAIEGRLPALTNDQSADAVALIDTLSSQAFLAQIPNIKGMGALSNAEGEKLQSALQNLGRAQSEAQFRANLEEAARLLKKGREQLSRSTGVPLGKPDTPAAQSATVDDLLKKYGGVR